MPVIVIPGLLGSKLVQEGSGSLACGPFSSAAPGDTKPGGSRWAALPMQPGLSTSQLKDDLIAVQVLDAFTIESGPLKGVEVSVYVDILKTLVAGKYHEQPSSLNRRFSDGDTRQVFYQFAYDWRRDISEHSVALHRLVLQARAASPRNDKVDVVAHSMGGLLLRYYMMYGPNPLPDDGSVPPLTWEGAENIGTVIHIGTPNSGSVQSLDQLIRGIRFVPFLPTPYRAGLLGTMPAVYQLLPRTRHDRLVDATTHKPIDPLNVQTWIDMNWGLADPREDDVLRELLPTVLDPAQRRAIALDHLAKSLAKAEQFFRAIDRTPPQPNPPTLPAPPSPPAHSAPDGPKLFLIAGDGLSTADQMLVTPSTGRTRLNGYAPGDGVVSCSSALGDDRVTSGYADHLLLSPQCPRLPRSIPWTGVRFLPARHLELTRDDLFSDFVLDTLLKRPRPAIHKATALPVTQLAN